MSKPKEALIIGTRVATANHESGASLRLQTVKSALERSNFNVSISPLNEAKSSLTKHWDLIVVISYSSARILRRARKQTKFLWFDPTDSLGGIASKSEIRNGKKIKMISIDEEVKRQKLTGPFALKLDTHGFELPIFDGASNILKQCNLVIVECYNFKLNNNSYLKV